MRPIANFTFHAILAAAIAALATTSAAAQHIAGRFQLELGGNEEGMVSSTDSDGQAAKSDKPRIAVLEVQAFKWGNAADVADLGSWAKAEGLGVTWDVAEHRGVSKVDSFTVKQKAVEQGYQPGNTKYSNVKLSRATEAGGPAPGASETITSHGNRTESGLPTGKRQHKPFTLSQPLDKGSVWIRVASPWTGCRVGKRYPSLGLSDGSTNYRLLGVTVAGCGRSEAQADRPTEEVAFYYNKIAF